MPRLDLMGRQRSRRPRDAARGSALITGSYVTSLHAARSLASVGFHVIVGLSGEFSSTPYSRHCHEVFRHPPVAEPEGFLSALVDFVQARPDIRLILPLIPSHVGLMAANRHRLPDRPVLLMADPDVVLTCLDKGKIVALAEQLDVPVRPSRIATDLTELEAAADAIGYPCLVKSSSDRFGLLPGHRKAIRCLDLSDLRRALPAWPVGHPTLIVQPWVDGPRYNIDFAARDGRILMAAHALALRTDRSDGTGSGVDILVTHQDARLVQATERILGHLRYTGLGGIQFMVPDQGEPHLLEINPRVAMPARIWATFGFDPVLAACQLGGVDVGWREDRTHAIAPGMRGVWTSRDVYGLLTTIGRGEIGPRQALTWAAAIIRAAVAADAHMTWAWDDPLPTLVAWAKVLAPGTWLTPRRAGSKQPRGS